MYIHKEGHRIITISSFITFILLIIIFALDINVGLRILFSLPFIFLFAAIISFFRIPNRTFVCGDNKIISPADGTIVVIEETVEHEVLKEKCRQISVFMSPANVHVNRYPIDGRVIFSKHHHGKYLVASHPKSSLENERTTVYMETENGTPIVLRQVAGALARRIVCYAQRDKVVEQNQEMGFIKFGSRVDIFLPLSAKICVDLGQKVQNGITVLAELEQ